MGADYRPLDEVGVRPIRTDGSLYSSPFCFPFEMADVMSDGSNVTQILLFELGTIYHRQYMDRK